MDRNKLIDSIKNAIYEGTMNLLTNCEVVLIGNYEDEVSFAFEYYTDFKPDQNDVVVTSRLLEFLDHRLKGMATVDKWELRSNNMLVFRFKDITGSDADNKLPFFFRWLKRW